MSDDAPLLAVRGLRAGYGASSVLFGVDLDVPPVGTLAVVGRNGAGKTTLLRCLLGYHRPSSGTVRFDGADLGRLPTAARARRGIGYVPQEHVVFPSLTVRDNLRLGVLGSPRDRRAGIDEALTLFPKLADRLDQQAGTMSGGERKMVGIARALLGRPRLLVLDEPTEGVWHGVVDEILGRLRSFAEQAAVLLVEQHLDFALDLADRAVVLERGEVVLEGTPGQLRADPSLSQYVAL